MCVLFFCGCDSRPVATVSHVEQTHSPQTLISDEDRRFSFGTIISKPGRQVVHRYRLANPTSREVQILDLVNRKSCCGVIVVGSKKIRPGESTEVEVTLVVGEKFGGIVHEAEILTDLPADSSILLLTSAVGQPALRVEEVAHTREPIIQGSGRPVRSEYRVIACGTSNEAPFNLDQASLRSGLEVEWLGPKETGAFEDDLRTESRRLVATIDPAGPIGDRREEVLIRDGASMLHRFDLTWSIVEPIAITPKVMIIRAGEKTRRVTLRSRDRSEYSITRIEYSTSGMKARALGHEAAATQVIEVDGDLAAIKDRRGLILVFTDLPTQGKVEVPFFVID